jgi:adenine-specific DNA-methyltransferase
MPTPYHSKYWAALLSAKGAAGSIASISRSLASARVDLNPHQVDAALFALRSPLSKGVILADEVGLGKTIEACIVIAQRWAERRRRILLILPATLRKQWEQELLEKFGLESVILEAKSYSALRKAGNPNPFEQRDKILICSYHFAAAKAREIAANEWDLVVIDEAHRLRNVYKSSNKIATAISESLRDIPKVLLTATPLQNRLEELYGLVSVIDDQVFGDFLAFREQFLRARDEKQRNGSLKERLGHVCTRTLRKQVLEYVRFTQRTPITQDFTPTAEEQRLYEMVSAYLQRDQLFALPASQRSLLTLILRKLLASSTFAIAGTLHSLVKRLESQETSQSAGNAPPPAPAASSDDPIQDFEASDELRDEWNGEESATPEFSAPAVPESAEAALSLSPDQDQLRAELADLRAYVALADQIQSNSKGDALLHVLGSALAKAESLGAARKAVIFTESRRTQQYLFDLLSARGYGGQIVLINGDNNDARSRSIYERWYARHAGTDAISASRSADMKAAIVEEFRQNATLLIATESAAEGVNLQFCSLVINYDLPWNPQRIEQRIGRCHRYGQKHDVVVVNFLNRGNAADQRVFELLSSKFRLFDGVFGASDEVLGALESGVDIEKRIARVYQESRTAEEIQQAFDQLQADLEREIEARMAETRQKILEHLDEDVHRRLRTRKEQAESNLNVRQEWLLSLARQELAALARFEETEPRFHYQGNGHPAGSYHLDWRRAEALGDHFFSQQHALAAHCIETALARPLPTVQLHLDYAAHGRRITVLEPYCNRSGWLWAFRLVVNSFQEEEFVLLAAVTDDGEVLDHELCDRLLNLPARTGITPGPERPPAIKTAADALLRQTLEEVAERNLRFFDEEVAKLDRWAEDLKLSLEQEIKELDREIRDARKTALLAITLREKLDAQKALKSLQEARNRKRKELFEAQDAVEAKRDTLIENLERQSQQTHDIHPLFELQWIMGDKA